MACIGKSPESSDNAGGLEKKDKSGFKKSLDSVIEGLNSNCFTREEIDRLSHSLGQAFHNLEPEPELASDVELHAMLGKKPLHVSSEFLSEALSAISIKPDGIKRYSYKNLINPDVSGVEGLKDIPEKALPRRLSLMSDKNVAHSSMSPMNDEERIKRRASLPVRDLALGPLLNEDSDEEKEEVWEASDHILKVIGNNIDLVSGASSEASGTNEEKEGAELTTQKNNNACTDVKSGQLPKHVHKTISGDDDTGMSCSKCCCECHGRTAVSSSSASLSSLPGSEIRPYPYVRHTALPLVKMQSSQGKVETRNKSVKQPKLNGSGKKEGNKEKIRGRNSTGRLRAKSTGAGRKLTTSSARRQADYSAGKTVKVEVKKKKPRSAGTQKTQAKI